MAFGVLHQTEHLQTLGKIKADLEGRQPLVYQKIPSRKTVTVLSVSERAPSRSRCPSKAG